MPVVACYDMHLYCDVPECTSGGYGERGQAEFTGDDTGSAARARARRAGWWLVGGADAALCACPPCKKAGHRPTKAIE